MANEKVILAAERANNAAEVNHNPKFKVASSVYTLNLGYSFTKPKLFVYIVSISHGTFQVNWHMFPFNYL